MDENDIEEILSSREGIGNVLSQDEEEKINFISKAKLPTKFGEFDMYAFEDSKLKTHLALVRGDVKGKEKVATRIHSKCLTGDSLCSLRCDCHDQLQMSMKYLGEQKEGVLLYMNQEGRGIGLANKIRAYALQDKGMDTVEANLQLGFADDLRTYDVSAYMLKWLGIKSIVLMSNNPRKVRELTDEGIEVVKRMPIIPEGNEKNKKYLKTKKDKLGHLLDEQD